MKTKKNVEVLLENGIHFNTIMGLNDKQVKLLAEKFFKSKPMGNVEPAKKETKEAQTYTTQTKIFNPTSTTDKGEFDKLVNNSPNRPQITMTKNNQVAVTTGNVPNLEESGEMTEKFESKAQQGLFWTKCKNSTGKKKKEWCNRAEEFSSKTTKKDYESMPEKKHPEKTVKKTTKKQTDESYERFLEERIYEMIEKHVEPSMTKRDFIKSIQEKKNGSENFMLENPKKNSMFAKDEGLEMKRPIGKLYSKEMKENTTEKERTTTKPTVKPKKKNPHKDPAPGVDENPKAKGSEKEAPSKPGIKTPTRRKNPHKDPAPDVVENPKAEEQKNDFMSAITSILNNA